MEWFVKAFIKSSVTWLVIGAAIGIAMAVHPAWTVYRPAHAHVMLLGFVTMMISGVAYHVVPRLSARPLFSPRLAMWHVWIANIGLLIMIAGFGTRPANATAGTTILGVGGLISGLGTLLFAIQIWLTLERKLVMKPVDVGGELVGISRKASARG